MPYGSTRAILHLCMSATKAERARYAEPLRDGGLARQAPDARLGAANTVQGMLAATCYDRTFGFPKFGRPLHEEIDPSRTGRNGHRLVQRRSVTAFPPTLLSASEAD